MDGSGILLGDTGVGECVAMEIELACMMIEWARCKTFVRNWVVISSLNKNKIYI